MNDYLFEVYHYCSSRAREMGLKSIDGTFPTVDEAEVQRSRLELHATLTGLGTRYYIQQFDLGNIAEFFREYPL